MSKNPYTKVIAICMPDGAVKHVRADSRKSLERHIRTWNAKNQDKYGKEHPPSGGMVVIDMLEEDFVKIQKEQREKEAT